MSSQVETLDAWQVVLTSESCCLKSSLFDQETNICRLSSPLKSCHCSLERSSADLLIVGCESHHASEKTTLAERSRRRHANADCNCERRKVQTKKVSTGMQEIMSSGEAGKVVHWSYSEKQTCVYLGTSLHWWVNNGVCCPFNAEFLIFLISLSLSNVSTIRLRYLR